MPGKQIASELKQAIVSYWERNHFKNGGQGPTMQSLSDIFGVKRHTIYHIIQKYKKSGSVANIPKAPRKKCTTARQDRQILIDVKRDPFVSAG